jgi:hypothetical protein
VSGRRYSTAVNRISNSRAISVVLISAIVLGIATNFVSNTVVKWLLVIVCLALLATYWVMRTSRRRNSD